MAATMSAAESQTYQEGRRAGAADFHAEAPYRPDSRRPQWSQGYCDGWTAASEAAEFKDALERERARINATEYASLDDLLAEFD